MKNLDVHTRLTDRGRITAISRVAPLAPLGIALLIAGAACGGSSSIPASNAATNRATSATSAPTPPQGGPVPDALQRTWVEVGSTIDAHLTFGPHTYTATQTGGSATGDVAVNGDEIDFFNGTICNVPLPQGIGRYRWTLNDAGTLHFSSISPDMCGRSQILANADYRTS